MWEAVMTQRSPGKAQMCFTALGGHLDTNISSPGVLRIFSIYFEHKWNLALVSSLRFSCGQAVIHVCSLCYLYFSKSS